MSISPISSISQYVYLPSLSTNEQERSEELKKYLAAYNIKSTGDNVKDLELLKQAMLVQMLEEQREKQINQLEEDYRPWEEIMWELGLSKNETIEEDYNDIMEELDYRLSNAQDEEEYDKYNDMRVEAQEYFNEYTQGSGEILGNPYTSAMIGMSLLAVMNMMDHKINHKIIYT